jgi:hypothetical protein
MRGLRHDADGLQVAKTVSEAHDLPLGFRMARSDKRIHSLGCFHIGGVAYFVWALPPNVGGTAQRYIQAIGQCVGARGLMCRRGAHVNRTM